MAPIDRRGGPWYADDWTDAGRLDPPWWDHEPGQAIEMGPDQHRTFAALLRRHREAAGLTQEALAERAGLSTRAIAYLERGAHTDLERHE